MNFSLVSFVAIHFNIKGNLERNVVPVFRGYHREKTRYNRSDATLSSFYMRWLSARDSHALATLVIAITVSKCSVIVSCAAPRL
jgi:hypothetical protein